MYDHGELLGDGPQAGWAAAMEVHARIQQTWTNRTDELIRHVASVRLLPTLATDLTSWAADEAFAMDLGDADFAARQESVPAFVAACHRMDQLGPAPTLVHGDLYPWNVAMGPDGPVIFDWSDPAITHPFIDLALYATRSEDGAIRRTISNTYLGQWADHLSPAGLAEAGDLALVVGSLYQAYGYRQALAHMESADRLDMEPGPGQWARASIDTLRHGIDAPRRPGAENTHP